MKETARGFDPMDKKWFTGQELMKIQEASVDMQFLLNRGYNISSSTEFVGNHFLLSLRQRNALKRSLSSQENYIKRQNKLLDESSLKNSTIFIDGFNLIITLEVALSSSLLILGKDGALRDLAGLRGTYKIIDKTYKALGILKNFLSEAEVSKAVFYLDQPVSNSGNLGKLINEIFLNSFVETEVSIVKSPDKVLKTCQNVISSDAIILDHCNSWFNLSKLIADKYIPDAWIIDFK